MQVSWPCVQVCVVCCVVRACVRHVVCALCVCCECCLCCCRVCVSPLTDVNALIQTTQCGDALSGMSSPTIANDPTTHASLALLKRADATAITEGSASNRGLIDVSALIPCLLAMSGRAPCSNSDKATSGEEARCSAVEPWFQHQHGTSSTCVLGAVCAFFSLSLSLSLSLSQEYLCVSLCELVCVM